MIIPFSGDLRYGCQRISIRWTNLSKAGLAVPGVKAEWFGTYVEAMLESNQLSRVLFGRRRLARCDSARSCPAYGRGAAPEFHRTSSAARRR